MNNKVLVVDDDATIRSILEHILNSYDIKIDVIRANNSAEALEISSGDQFDVIFLDIKMPDGNGVDLIPQLKELQHEAIICMVSAVYDNKEIKRSLDYGAVGYLKKPFTKNQVINLMKRFSQNSNNIDKGWPFAQLPNKEIY